MAAWDKYKKSGLGHSRPGIFLTQDHHETKPSAKKRRTSFRITCYKFNSSQKTSTKTVYKQGGVRKHWIKHDQHILSIITYQLLSIIINYYQLLSIIINYYQLLSIIINYYQLLSITINYYQLLSIIIIFNIYDRRWRSIFTRRNKESGRMEGWKDGRMEGWKDGRMEEWKNGRMEGWKDGRMEGWKKRWRSHGKCKQEEPGGSCKDLCSLHLLAYVWILQNNLVTSTQI